MAAALKTERDYFDNHPAYRHLPKEMLTTESLIHRMTSVMYTLLKTVLPSIIKEINKKIENCENSIAALGVPIPEDNQ